MSNAIYIMDLFGVMVFALSGALAAARKQLDVFGFVIVGLAPAIGGGTLRDVVMGATPVFWLIDPNYLYVCAATAICAFFWAHKVTSRFKILIWADAFGLALFAIIGTQKAMAWELPIAGQLAMGVMTASFGGMLRDILCAEVPLLLRKEIYALAALAGSAVLVVATSYFGPGNLAFFLSFATTFAIRALAILRGWSMPIYTRQT